MSGCPHIAQQPGTQCQLCGYPVPADRKEVLRERFRKVILMAGYQNPEPILAEWFEKYYNDSQDPGQSQFIAMLERYEQEYKEEGEII